MVDMEVRKREVQGEGKVKETTMEATDSHSFKSTNLKRPTWCDHCGKLIWGLYNQGQKCGECGIKIHHKCHHSVSDFCGSPPKGVHNFKVASFKKPTWCNHCGKMIYGFVAQGRECSECGTKIHHKCHPFTSEEHCAATGNSEPGERTQLLNY